MLRRASAKERYAAVLAAKARRPCSPPAAQQRAAIREIKARLQLYNTGLDVDYTSDEVWHQALVDTLIPAEGFVAGETARYCHAWDEWLPTGEGPAAAVRQVVSEGIRLDFVHPTSQEQHGRPQYQDKVQQVRRLLQRTVQRQQAEGLLDRDSPGPVQFLNRTSVEDHLDFVLEEATRLRESGAWKTPEELGMARPPFLIHGLGVVVNRHGKLRLVVDARYLNLFLRWAQQAVGKTGYGCMGILQGKMS